MPGAQVTVLYPEDAKFNMDYYLQSHMPMVEKEWSKFGLTNWSVLKFTTGPYSVQATLQFKSYEDYENATKAEEVMKRVIGDVENFSDKGPLLLPSNVMGQQA